MKKVLVVFLSMLPFLTTQAQITERELSAEWKNLVEGARFMDRFLPMPKGKTSKSIWGVTPLQDRYVDNGIEDNIRSYWGGNILKGEDGKYHLFVCAWPENSPKGHMFWPNSVVYHAECKNSIGPFIIKDTIGLGHNPEIFKLNDDRYIIYVAGGYYISDNLDGPWKYNKFEFDKRDRKIIEGLSNLTFTKREDGSYLMVCRGGGVWISKTGESTYNQISDKSVYPPVEGEFEDPVVWKDHVQYHLIVNDWLGRIAFYLRSKDGVKWVTDPGEAYVPGISKHKDGYIEEWFKYERIKMLQDSYGRAIQANFAVIDTIKWNDLPNDRHSSKNISIPLNPGMLLVWMDSEKLSANTKTIRIKIESEDGFNPQKEVDLESLRLGASTEVDFGRGCKAIKSEKSGKDLIVTFSTDGHGIQEDEFAPKVIGKTKKGEMLYGYMRLPWVEYIDPILSARKPSKDGQSVVVENFGQVASQPTIMFIEGFGEANIPIVKPYGKYTVYK